MVINKENLKRLEHLVNTLSREFNGFKIDLTCGFEFKDIKNIIKNKRNVIIGLIGLGLFSIGTIKAINYINNIYTDIISNYDLSIDKSSKTIKTIEKTNKTLENKLLSYDLYDKKKLKEMISDFSVLCKIDKRVNKDKKTILESVIEAEKIYNYVVDPVFIASYLKKESGFEKYAISYVGAAGESQITPILAKEMGLKVYLPKYYVDAWNLFISKKRINLKNKATNALLDLDFKKAERYAKEYYKIQKKIDKSFKRYKKELKEMIRKGEIDKIDERFSNKGVKKSIIHFAYLLKRANGDLRVAISAYHAGNIVFKKYPHIPWIYSTVKYQNDVLNNYTNYKREILRAKLRR